MSRDTETAIGGAASRFPATRWSVVGALRSDLQSDRVIALETLAQLYWKPVYKYLRIKWNKSNEDAKDLTQSFFARAIEKRFFDSYDPSKSRFRTFVRTCLDGFVANEEKASMAQKRGGGFDLISLDFHQAEAELAKQQPSPDDCFEKEWVRSLFSTAIEEFRKHCLQEGKGIHFRMFERYDVEREPGENLSYGDLAAEFKVSVATVTNYLAYARREFRKLALSSLQKISGSEEEFRTEARRLLGTDIS